MAEWVVKIGGTNTPMNQDEQNNNAECFMGLMSKTYGWSLEAICGALGCFHEESMMNPGVYETSHGGNLNNLPYFPGGMGLAQWTDYPAYTATYPNPLPWSANREGEDWWNGNFQGWLLTKADDNSYTAMGYGQGPRWGWQQSSSYPSIPFSQYVKETNYSIELMTEYWFFDMEWHYSEVPSGYLTARKEWANYFYDYLQGKDPDIPGGGGTPVDPTDPTENEWYMYAILKAQKIRRRRGNGRHWLYPSIV